MREGPWYHLLVLCWKNGQRSPIHDHAGSTCGVRVLRGVLTETTFAFAPNGHVKAVGSRDLAEGQVCGTQDDDLHQISNLQAGEADLVTLHVYTPPLESDGHVFDVRHIARPGADAAGVQRRGGDLSGGGVARIVGWVDRGATTHRWIGRRRLMGSRFAANPSYSTAMSFGLPNSNFKVLEHCSQSTVAFPIMSRKSPIPPP